MRECTSHFFFWPTHPHTRTHRHQPNDLFTKLKRLLAPCQYLAAWFAGSAAIWNGAENVTKKKKTTHYPPKWTTNTLISLHFKFSFQQNPKMSLFPLCSVLLHCPPSPEQISLPSPPHHLEDVMPLGSVSTRLPLPKTHYVTLLKGQCT